MKRTTLTSLLIPIVCVASCARVNALRGATGVPDQRILKLWNGISVDAGPALTALPPDQRYRFVSPDALAKSLGPYDESSFGEPQLAAWREEFSTVMERGRWVESADSAEFEVTILGAVRMSMRRAGSPQQSRTFGSSCQYLTTDLQPCPDDASLVSQDWDTEYRMFYIIRRRADGAVRVWHKDRRRVAADLLDMLRSGAHQRAPRAVSSDPYYEFAEHAIALHEHVRLTHLVESECAHT